MYLPQKFNETRPALLHALVHAHPLGTVVTHGAGGLDANHIPFEIEAASPGAPFGILRGHVARANPLWRREGDGAGDGQDVLAIFQGPSAYITPALYDEKQASGKVVPTYHYAVVHAHGKLRAIDDPAWMRDLLTRLTARHEAPQARPWSMEDAPPDFIARLMKAVVGIEIRIERMQGKWKTGQDDTMADQRRMELQLGEPMASLMQERRAARE